MAFRKGAFATTKLIYSSSMTNNFFISVTTAGITLHFASGGIRATVVNVVVFRRWRTHHTWEMRGCAVRAIAELTARGFVALHLNRWGMLSGSTRSKLKNESLGTHAFQVFLFNETDAFLLWGSATSFFVMWKRHIPCLLSSLATPTS